jgi:hypothetical protein
MGMEALPGVRVELPSPSCYEVSRPHATAEGRLHLSRDVQLHKQSHTPCHRAAPARNISWINVHSIISVTETLPSNRGQPSPPLGPPHINAHRLVGRPHLLPLTDVSNPAQPASPATRPAVTVGWQSLSTIRRLPPRIVARMSANQAARPLQARRILLPRRVKFVGGIA